MVTRRRQRLMGWMRKGLVGGLLASAVGLSTAAKAAVTASGDPADRYGATPNVFTVDPRDANVVTANANRGIANTRKLRQTFKNPSTFNVGQINLSFDVTGGSSVGSVNDTGLKLAFFEVEDVLSSNWTPGTLIKEVTIQPGTMPGADQVFRVDLTGGDVFELLQRNTGAQGYGLEISTPNALSSDGNPGLLYFSNVSTPVDYYADGRYYTEAGTASNSWRDVGLSLIASTEVACDPGDVNCDMTVDEIDLGIIADHFRQSGGRELGDLSGNGFIDFDDFGLWKTNYTGPALGAGAFSFLSVPEPSSVVMLLMGAIGLLPRTFRRQLA